MVRSSPARVLVILVTGLVSLLCLAPAAHASAEGSALPATVATQLEPLRDVAVRLVAGRSAPGPVEVGTHLALHGWVGCLPAEVVAQRRLDGAHGMGDHSATSPGDDAGHPIVSPSAPVHSPAPAATGPAPDRGAGRGPPPPATH